MNSEILSVGGASITLLSLAISIALLVTAWLVSALVRRAVRRAADGKPRSAVGAYYAIGKLLHYVILVGGVMLAASALGLDISKFTILISAIGVGLGFGLQQIINNLVSGLILLFEQSLKVGDFVELESGVIGEVREINIRSTRITTPDNIDVLVPNSVFIGGAVTNWTLREAWRRFRVPFGVAYGTDKELVKKAALQAAAQVSFTMVTDEHSPQVWLVEFGASSLNFELVVTLNPEAVKRPDAVLAAYNWAIESALAEHGIEIPFDQRDLNVRSVFGLEGDQAIQAFGMKRGATTAQADPLSATERASLEGNDALQDASRGLESQGGNQASEKR